MENKSPCVEELDGRTVLIDTSSLFHFDSVERFFAESGKYGINIRVPDAAFRDIREIRDINEYRKINGLLSEMSRLRRFKYIGIPGESSADSIVRYCMQRRMKIPLAVITQDKRLGRDIMAINAFKSSVGRTIPIYHFNFDSDFEAFSRRVDEFCKEAEELINMKNM